MEDFKLEHFKKNNPGIAFPSYRPLLSDECGLIRTKVAKAIGIDSEDSLQLVKRLAETATHVEGINAESSDFDYLEVCLKNGIQPKNNVLVNWYRFDKIDEFGSIDLKEYFDDIWYPSSDDIDIFDETLTWFLLVQHDGTIYLNDLR